MVATIEVEARVFIFDRRGVKGGVISVVSGVVAGEVDNLLRAYRR